MNPRLWKWIILTVTPIVITFVFSLIIPKESVKEIQPVIDKITKFNPESFIAKSPTIESIFDDDNKWIATLSAEKIKTIIFTGDVIPARSVNAKTVRTNDFNWPYLKTFKKTRDADLTVANLESPLIQDCPITDEGMVFCGASENVQGLVFAGIDIVSIANNHFANYGEEGIRKTVDLLTKNNINTVGLDTILVREIKDTKFGFLAYNDIEKNQAGINNVDEEKIKKDIKNAKKISDLVIIIFHWGEEYRDLPDDRQKTLAHFAVDNGADLIIGNHPHWIQPLEIYKNKIIVYAHGNFVFDQMWSLKTRQGIIGKYTFYENKLIDIKFLPVQIEDYGQPYFLEGDKGLEILKTLKEKSIILSKNE